MQILTNIQLDQWRTQGGGKGETPPQEKKGKKGEKEEKMGKKKEKLGKMTEKRRKERGKEKKGREKENTKPVNR